MKEKTITINPETLHIDKEELEEAISIAISDITGFCHTGFSYTIEVVAQLDDSE
jgi:hypothetical protein